MIAHIKKLNPFGTQLIIHRYIYSEIWLRFLWIISLLFLIYLSIKFIDLLSIINTDHTYSAILMKMLGTKLLSTSPKLLIVAAFLATILSYSRLSSDNEITIMSISGVSKLEQLKIVLLACLPIYLIVSCLALLVSPWAEDEYKKLQHLLSQNAAITGITASQFRAFNNGKYVIYVESISADQKNMGNVFIQIEQHDTLSILTAQEAHLTLDKNSGKRHIVLFNGQHYILPVSELDYKITDYQRYEIVLEPLTAVANMKKSSRSLATASLLFSDKPTHQAELQWRISLILSSVLLPMLALLLTQSPLGQRRLALILVSILAYFFYTDLLGISKSLLNRDAIPATIGLWWVHALLIMIMLALYHTSKIRRYLKFKKPSVDEYT